MPDNLTQPDSPTHERVWYRAFLVVLAMRDNVSEACREAGVSRATAYDAREKDAAFRQAWENASRDAADKLELEARRRAEEGVERYVLSKGNLVWVWVLNGEIVPPETEGAKLVALKEREYSDTLMQTLLKGAKPEKYRDRVEHSTPDGQSLFKVYVGVDTDKV